MRRAGGSFKDSLRAGWRRVRAQAGAGARTHRWWLPHGIHLAVLWSFAVLQPTLSYLGGNVEALIPRQVGGFWFILMFAALALVPPALLLAVEALAGLASARLRYALHLAFSGALIALFALYALAGDATDGSLGLVLASVAIGLVATAAYAVVRPARSFLTALAPAPLAFLIFFLLFTPAKGLAFPPDTSPGEVAGEPSPVVFVLLDELPVSSLMTPDGDINAARFPAFGELARDSTWYRNTVSLADHTVEAVPPIVTGQRPEPPEPLPTFAGHPRNLFTFLGASHDVRAAEYTTWLCPNSICPGDDSGTERALALASFVSRASTDAVLPGDMAEALGARIGLRAQTWGEAASFDLSQPIEPATASRVDFAFHPDAQFERFIAGLGDSEEAEARPPLEFLHLALPHTPWRYLPTGQTYPGGTIAADVTGSWAEDPALVDQSRQQHMLQVEYTDRLLGKLMDRLRDSGSYEESLIVVVSDHGVSFEPGAPRRDVTAQTAAQIGMVPLFIKAPGQASGEVADRPATTADVLPTVADHLDVELPWETDGESLLVERRPEDQSVTIVSGERDPVETTFAELRDDRAEFLERQVELFGPGGGAWDLFGLGPYRELVGARPEDLPAVAPSDVEAKLHGEEALRAVDPDSYFVPALLKGRLSEPSVAGTDLAFAVNGRIAAVGRSYIESGGSVRFSTVVPSSILQSGENVVEVFAIRGRPGRPALQSLGGTG